MLILRKECQDKLDEHGLEDFHIEINDEKKLAIIGECGQPLVNIQGIAFAKKQITVSEREYAVELFEKFLDKYTNKISDMLKMAKEEREARANLSDLDVKLGSSIALNGSASSRIISIFNLKLNEKVITQFNLRADNSFTSNSTFTLDEVIQVFEIYKDDFNKLTDFMKKSHIHDDVLSRYRKMKAELQSCNI